MKKFNYFSEQDKALAEFEEKSKKVNLMVGRAEHKNGLPKAKCKKCGSTNLKDTGSFLVEIHKCQDCGELFCEDSGDAGYN